MNRNYSVICYIVSYILSMTCMPAIILSVLAIVQQERKQDRTLAVISLLYAFILALFIGVIVLM